ncbi:protein SPA1-RELATED 4-like isoform X2 [Phoenix dactylifera]|uniref:Protein SPA1-RELATED 4-like isoform X2 n=1 Tax=Phoenix dactylifera TaxID=42345 RepID=A0A8B9A3Y3_PHODC|nr:protein SPA1-RELATED 4-like isoform X2 [Phoenix dactylifera]
MEGSEEASGWERSSASRAPNTADCVASSDSLGAAAAAAGWGGKSMEEGEEEEEMGRPLSCTEDGSFRPAGAAVASAAAEEEEEEELGDVSLREWLDWPGRPVDLLESLHVFRQIVEAVSLAHSQGVVVGNVRPSCFVLSSVNRVSFIESASCSTSGSDSCEDTGGGSDEKPTGRRLVDQEMTPEEGTSEKASDTSCLRSGSAYPEEVDGGGREVEVVGEEKKAFPLKQILLMELNWYTSPEEAGGSPSTFASDIYRLGVLLFELFCTFNSLDEKLRTMSNLRHRVLPPQLLLKWPKEASFCLWLLHPKSESRPKISEILQSEFLNQPKDSLEERETAIKLREEIEDQELLLEFLLQLQQRKQEAADRLHDTICFLSADIEEVLNQQSILKQKGGSYTESDKEEHSAINKEDSQLQYPAIDEDSSCSSSRKRFRPGIHNLNEEEHNNMLDAGPISEILHPIQENIPSKSSRLMKNFKKLVAAYFSTRYRMVKPSSTPIINEVTGGGRGSVVVRSEGSSVDDMISKEGHYGGRKNGWINPFLEGLCKFMTFSKLKVKAELKQGDVLSSSNLVCSLGFDRDKEFFAAAGVNRKIKIFECDMILSEDRDIHYPVVEMASRSKLSCICWNNYIKNQIASSDFEGRVQVWDVTRSHVFMEMREHEKRVWSVDFSLADPTKLASGSDDGAVKLWNINQAGSIGTIRTKANVCSVQFQPDSACLLAIGSADHNVYCYDLRNMRMPFYTLVGHTKTVSYTKYLDSSNIASASTDSSLKLWDFSSSTSRILDNPLRTFSGHTNVKNFVGLSISDGYIATGSETNEMCLHTASCFRNRGIW